MAFNAWNTSWVLDTISCTVSCPKRHSDAVLISLVGCCCCDGFCCCWFPCCCCCVLLWLATCWCCCNFKITSIFFCGLLYVSVSIVDYTAVIVGQLLTEKLDMEEAVVTELNMVTNFFFIVAPCMFLHLFLLFQSMHTFIHFKTLFHINT